MGERAIEFGSPTAPQRLDPREDELLTPETIGETFDRGEPWTVQRSVDGAEPKETAVATAVFAGR